VRQFFKRGLGANFMPRRQLGKAQWWLGANLYCRLKTV
jgi:hypothetical protein